MSAGVASPYQPVGTGSSSSSDGGPRRYLGVVVAALVLVLLVTLVWVVQLTKSPPVRGMDGGSDRFPSETLSDWVSYGDHVAIVTVVDEKALPEDEMDSGSGIVPREVTLRIEEAIWSREGAPPVDDEVRVVTWGWIVEDGERQPVAARGGPRLELQSRYVTPLVRAPRDGVDWTPLSDSATLPLDGDRISTTKIVGSPSPIALDLDGATTEELATAVAQAAPDPVAAKHFDLPPDERWEAVLRETGGN